VETVGGFRSSLTDGEWDAFREAGTVRRLRRGAYLFTEGEASAHVALVLSGRVKASSFTADGKEVVLALRGPGDLLGELSALDGGPRSASVAALEPVEALVVGAERFTTFLEEHPRVAVLLVQTLAGRIREADRKRIEFGAFDTTGRVARRLVELAERFGQPEDDGVRIDVPLSQEELAGWTGSSREAVSKALRSLRERGWIETGRRAYIVRDLESLRRRST